MVISEITREGFCVGQKLTFTRKVTTRDVELFSEATGDSNPIHLDEEFASTTRFKHRIAQGMLGASYISGILGMELPGTIYMHQDLDFKRPVYIDDTVTVIATITEFDPRNNVATLATIVTNQDGKEVITGKAIVLVDGVRKRLSFRHEVHGATGAEKRD